MRFDKILLAGSGKIACDCLNYILTLVYQKDITVLETADSPLSMLRQICVKREIEYVLEQEETEKFILNYVRKKRTLIISANNRFIFTPTVINTPGTIIINFHYALLPLYRGMNIPTWVIYNQEKETGVTWHYVTEKIDHGRIISQKRIEIDEKMTAFNITRKGMVLGLESFKEFIGILLEKEIEGKMIDYPEDALVYRSSMLPMNGVLELPLPVETVIRMLRSFDYGGAKVIPKLRIKYENQFYLLEKYAVHDKLCKAGNRCEIQGEMLVIMENGKEVVLNVKEEKVMNNTENGGGYLTRPLG